MLASAPLPSERGVQRHAIDPGGHRRIAAERIDAVPHLQRDFLEQIRAVGVRAPIGAGYLEQDGLVRLDPLAEYPVAFAVGHFPPLRC